MRTFLADFDHQQRFGRNPHIIQLGPIHGSLWCYPSYPAAQQALISRCLSAAETMVIALLASFTQLLFKRGCQNDPCFVGDFLRVAVEDRPAKSPKGPRRMPTLCGVSYRQMAKIEQNEVWRIPLLRGWVNRRAVTYR